MGAIKMLQERLKKTPLFLVLRRLNYSHITLSSVICDFDFDNIRRLDGGLLLVFRELLLRRRATEVAAKLGLSQSAISHSLNRLRDIFNDPLFIRRPHGLEPTRRALELGPRVESLIDLAVGIISSDEGFDPLNSRRRFSLAAPDFITSLIGARLVQAFQSKAPQAAFISRNLFLDTALSAVRLGEADLALGQFGRLPHDLLAEVLYEDHYCVVARKGHPRIKGTIDLPAYAEIGHVFVGRPSGTYIGEAPYDQEQLTSTYGRIPDPDVVATVAYVSQWETAMLIVASSDAIADCPRRIVERYAKSLRLQVLDAPYETKIDTVYAVRRANASDPGVDWFLDQVRKAAGEGLD